MRRVSYTPKKLTRYINKNQALCYLLGLIFCLAGNILFAQTKINDNPIAKSLRVQPLDSSFVWMYENVPLDHVDHDNFHAVGLQTLDRVYLTENDSLIAEAHLLLSEWHGNTMAFSVDSVLYHTKKVVEYFTKTGNQRKIAFHSTSLAKNYLFLHEYEEGQEVLFNAINIYEALGDEQGTAEAYRILSAFAFDMEEPLQSIKYAEKAFDLFEKLKDYKSMARVYLGCISVYQMLGQYEKAYQVATDCIEIVETKVPQQRYPTGTIVLGKSTTEKDIIGAAYCDRGNISIITKDYERALEDYTKAWQLSIEQYGVKASEGWRSQVGVACRHLGRYEEALEHLLVGNKIRERTGGHLLRFYLETAKCYEQMGNYPKALEYWEISMAENDRLYKAKIANLESEAVVKYETGKKDQALAAQEEQLVQKSKIQNLTFGIVALLAAMLFALSYYFRKNKKINTQLNIKNKENELLLKEIHHRVKNNLQTISSLLSLQSESITDKGAYDAVQESRNRVTSMALLHQKLYQGKNLAAIEMRDYFETIGKAIIDSFGEKAKNISLGIDMSEIELDVDTAIPVGLITNELITNSIKHAFPNKQKGQIKITLAQEKNGLLTLHITDNGQASLGESAVKKEKGFGTMLIQLLTTQLEGKLEKSTMAGTSTIIQFPRQEKSAA